MAWNQGNGNGNNNGYGQQQPQQAQYYGDDPYARMNNAREQGGARFPFIDAGKHLLCLAVLEKFQHKTDGPCARAIFEVVQSSVHPVGSFVVRIFKLVKQPKFDSQASDAELLAQMCIALKGVKPGYPIGNDIRVLLEERPQEQLARGTLVECNGVMNQKRTWTNLFWNTVEQSMEQIVQQRQRLEAKGLPATGPAQRGTGGGQYQDAPHPSQMQAPQQMAPQQQYAPPAQQGYQQQYAPPVQQAPAQPPQGGFLQQAPVGPGPQGGNGGGRPW